ncbi:TonB-dependent receptor plug domain-containing protein [candidate division KSB1 bacterium]|nr:TonB-dependent receptor plug domain-containing protein [candidate division KSB1 bacterium]
MKRRLIMIFGIFFCFCIMQPADCLGEYDCLSIQLKEFTHLPVDNLFDILGLQPGVFITPSGTVSLLGGFRGDTGYFINGVPVTDGYSGEMGLSLDLASIKEIQVYPASFDVEYGNSTSGIVNIITQRGQSKIQFSGKLYFGDYFSGDKIYNVVNKVTPVQGPGENDVKVEAESENPLAALNPAVNFEFNFGSPIKLFNKGEKFFMSGRYYSNSGYLYGRQWYTPQGHPGNSQLVAMNPLRKFSLYANSQWPFCSHVKASHSIFLDALEWQHYIHNYKYNPDGRKKQYSASLMNIVSLEWAITPSVILGSSFSERVQKTQSYVYKDPLAKSDYLVRVEPDSAAGIEGRIIDLNNSEDAEFFEYVKDQRIRYTWIIDPNGPAGYVDPDSAYAPAPYSFLNSGMDMEHFTRILIDYRLAQQLTFTNLKNNTIKCGYELKKYGLGIEQFTIRPAYQDGEQITPFRPTIPASSTPQYNEHIHILSEQSAFLSDKISLQNITIYLGLRYDHFDADGAIPVDPHDPSIYSPLTYKYMYKDWIPPAGEPSPQEFIEYQSKFVETTVAERRAMMQKKVSPKSVVSPRIRLSYSTGNTFVHFAFGRYAKIPLLGYFYTNPDYKLSYGGNNIFGNPDLQYQKTTVMELGFRKNFEKSIQLYGSIYKKDMDVFVELGPIVQTVNPALGYRQFVNNTLSTIKGGLLGISLQNRSFDTQLAYTFERAEVSIPADDPTYSYLSVHPQMPMQNRGLRHSMNGIFRYTMKSWYFTVTGRYYTGGSYSLIPESGSTSGNDLGSDDTFTNLAPITLFNLKISKLLSLGNVNVQFFLQVYNLFDSRGMINAYTGTGSAQYTKTIQPQRIPYHPARISTVEDYVNRPDWYIAPRQVLAGFEVKLD